MIISFEQNADFYAEIAENAREEGDYRKALRYFGDAVAREPSAYNLMNIAMLYQDMLRHDFTVEECFSILDSTRLDYDELSDIYLMLSESLGKLGYFIPSWHYLSKRAKLEKDIDEEEDIKLIIEDIYAKIEENVKSVKLNFSDVIREKQYLKCYFSANSLFLSNDCEGALECAKLIPDTAECYMENLILMAKCYLCNEQVDKAVECWTKALEINTNEGSAIDGLAVFSSNDKNVRILIDKFDSDREEDIKYVINAACIKGMYNKALDLVNKLLERDFYNPKNHFIWGAIKFNMGDKDAAQVIFRDALSMYNNKYPVEYMMHSFKRHKKLSVLFEYVPREFINRVTYLLRKEIKSYGFKSSFMSSNAFRQAVIYALSKNIDPSLSYELLNLMSKNCNNATLLAMRYILIKPNVHFEIRRKLIIILLNTLKRGRIRVVNENILSNLSLKTPPSYEIYSEKLKTAYCSAFAYLATIGIPFEKSLSRLTEKIYLSKYEINSSDALAAAITHICIVDKNFFSLENLAYIFGVDVNLIKKEISNIEELIN